MFPNKLKIVIHRIDSSRNYRKASIINQLTAHNWQNYLVDFPKVTRNTPTRATVDGNLYDFQDKMLEVLNEF